MGRQTTFDQAIADDICERLSRGETLVSICKREGMPKRTTVHDWRDAHPAFGEQFARARLEGYETWFEECVDIAEDGANDYTTRTRQDGSKDVVFDGEHVQRSKLRIETRLKLLARLDPKKYGERSQVAMTDTDGNDKEFAPIVFMPVEAKPRDET